MGSHFKIRAEKTGHYYTHGTRSSDTRFVWICLHGYGQLAKYFIRRFEFLPPESHFVIAPEGLNRFYFEGLNEKPVATWMTREDRLDEIADTIQFLEHLRKKIQWDNDPQVKVVYLGFSQGVTTLVRWLHDATPRADFLLLWAGGLPDDLRFEHKQDYFNQIPTHYFLGDEDPFISKDNIEEKKKLIQSIGFDTTLHSFHGAHTVDENSLRKWVDTYLH